MRLQSRCRLRLQLSEAVLGSLGSASKMAPSHRTGPHFVALSTELLKCPHIRAVGFFQNERMQGRSDNAIYDRNHTILNHPITFTTFYRPDRANLIQCDRVIHRDVNPRRQGSLGVILEPGYIKSVDYYNDIFFSKN